MSARHRDGARWRRLALVAYGNLFLAGRLPLEAWNGHHLFHDVRLQFRRDAVAPGPAVLAADGAFAWLQWLESEGVRRLGLATVPPAIGAGWPGHDAVMLVAEGPAGPKGWIGCDEPDTAGGGSALDNHDHQAAALDTYWSVGAVAPLGTANADWPRLQAQMRLALAGAPETIADDDAGDYFTMARADVPAWAAWPVLPPDPALAAPHRMLRELYRLRCGWDNFTHAKNDASPYVLAADPARAEWDAWHARLLAWSQRIELLAGNESRWRLVDQAPPPRSPPRPRPCTSATVDPAPAPSSSTDSGVVGDSAGDTPSVQPPGPIGKAVVTMLVVALAGAIVWAIWRHTPIALAVVATALAMQLLHRR